VHTVSDSTSACFSPLYAEGDVDSFLVPEHPLPGYPIGRPMEASGRGWGSGGGGQQAVQQASRNASSWMGSGADERRARAPLVHNHLALFAEFHEKRVGR
jgi:hypothetical protein